MYFRKTVLLVYSHSKLYSDYTLMNMTHLSQRPKSMNWIGEVYGIVGTASVTSFVGNHWATGRLQQFDPEVQKCATVRPMAVESLCCSCKIYAKCQLVSFKTLYCGDFSLFGGHWLTFAKTPFGKQQNFYCN